MLSFNSLKEQFGEESAMEIYTACKGKFIVTEVDDESVYIRSIGGCNDEWCNTRSTTKCRNGLFIMMITDIRQDVDGYPIFDVEPVKEIYKTVLDSKEMLALFYLSGLFVESGTPSEEFNYKFLIENAWETDHSINRYYVTKEKEIEKIVHLYLHGKMSEEKIIGLLSTPTEEQESDMWLRRECSKLEAGKYKDKYPLLTNIAERLSLVESAFDVIKRLLIDSSKAIIQQRMESCDYGDIFGQIERYLNLLGTMGQSSGYIYASPYASPYLSIGDRKYRIEPSWVFEGIADNLFKSQCDPIGEPNGDTTKNV